MPDPALEPGEPETPSAGVMAWNPDQTLERLGGDEKLLHEVLEIFLEEVPKHLLALREAITQRNAETVERIAHSLQGELGYLSIAELSHWACALEEKGRNSDFQGALSLFPPFEAAMARLLGAIGGTQKIDSQGQLAPGSSGVSP